MIPFKELLIVLLYTVLCTFLQKTENPDSNLLGLQLSHYGKKMCDQYIIKI